jgi:hypothetical protein
MVKRIHPNQLYLPLMLPTDCEPFDGPPTRWREKALDLTWIELAVEHPPLSWPFPQCGTPLCLNLGHLTWESPRRLLYPEGICVYCGLEATTRDHLLPRTWTGDAIRRHVLTVPACQQCNSIIGDRFVLSITDRRKYAQERIADKNRNLLNMPAWTPDEIAKLGKSLRSVVERGVFDRALLRDRLSWPKDPDYDVRAMQQSGIANPSELGLL